MCIRDRFKVPPSFALNDTPTPHSPFLAEAAITPAQRFPCLMKLQDRREEEELFKCEMVLNSMSLSSIMLENIGQIRNIGNYPTFFPTGSGTSSSSTTSKLADGS